TKQRFQMQKGGRHQFIFAPWLQKCRVVYQSSLPIMRRALAVMEHCENVSRTLLEQPATCILNGILGITAQFVALFPPTMPPRRAAAPAPTTPLRASSSADADDAEENKQETPTTPSPLKRRLAELTE